MGRQPLHLGRRHPPPVTLVANRPDLAGAVPAAQGIDADAQRARRLAELEIRHLPKHCIGKPGGRQMNAREWIDAFAAELGTEPPTADEIKQVLEIAAVAAHASERIAAPVACWVGGRAGASLDELQAAAERVSGEPVADDAT
jgi:hypothetical protein